MFSMKGLLAPYLHREGGLNTAFLLLIGYRFFIFLFKKKKCIISIETEQCVIKLRTKSRHLVAIIGLICLILV